jgi:hypothetical protein
MCDTKYRAERESRPSVNPGGTGGKWLEGGEASSALGVEKHAARSDAPESWHKKIARLLDQLDTTATEPAWVSNNS